MKKPPRAAETIEGRSLAVANANPNWRISYVPLPDCKGDLEWFEAGYVPGTRRCSTCCSLFSVQCGNGAVWLRWERLY